MVRPWPDQPDRRRRLCISLNGSPLELTPTFKYLGLLISSDLSWSSHIDNICSKAKRILGLLYRRFYRQSNEQTLRQLYVSLVRPHLEYAAPVWSPHLHKDITILEKIQQFASKMCTKIWNCSYNDLLYRLQLPTLAQRRLHLASSPGHSQILSRSHGEKSGEGLVPTLRHGPEMVDSILT